MSNAQMTYAMDSKDSLVHITNAANGLGCGLYCFECEEPVIAKQGKIMAWHFAHQAGSDCTGEGALHYAAKRRVFEWLHARSKYTVCMEAAVGNVRPDVSLWFGCAPMHFIEVVVSHWPEPAVYKQGADVWIWRVRGWEDLDKFPDIRWERHTTNHAGNIMWDVEALEADGKQAANVEEMMEYVREQYLDGLVPVDGEWIPYKEAMAL